MVLSTPASCDSGNFSRKFSPASRVWPSRGSMGIRPRNGAPHSSASFCPPPEENRLKHSYAIERDHQRERRRRWEVAIILGFVKWLKNVLYCGRGGRLYDLQLLVRWKSKEKKRGGGVLTEQCGQTKPDIFSMMPRIGSRAFLQKLASRRTSFSATPCGVVTSTAPSGL